MGDVEFSELAKSEGTTAIKNVRTSDNHNWCLFGYESSKLITYQDQGNGGIEELKGHFKEDQIQYALLKVTDTIDQLPVTRFVFIVWVGKSVKIFVKSMSTTHRGKMKDFIGQAHVTLDASSLDDLTEEIISQKVSDASGSSVRVLNENNEREVKTGQIKQQGKIESGSLNFIDQETIKGAIQHVRNTTNAWVFVAYQGQTNNIELVAKGEGGVNELAEHLKEDLLGFALVRVQIQFDSNIVVRYAVIDWVGKNISTVRKAKTVTFKGTILDFLGQAHVKIEASERNEINEEIVLEKVTQIAGTKSNVVEVDNNKPTPTSSTPSSHAPPSNTTTSSSSNTPKPIPKTTKVFTAPKNQNLVNTASLGLTFEGEECKEEIKKVRSDEVDNDYVLFGYVDNNPATAKLKLIASGNGGIAGISDNIGDEGAGVFYGLLRVNDVEVQSTKTVKFVFIIYIGEKIKSVQRAKLTTHKGSAQEMIGQVHCDLFASKKAELTQELVMEKVNSVLFKTNIQN